MTLEAKDHQIVLQVCQAYRTAIHNPFVRPFIKPEGKSWNNCLAFFALCKKLDRSLIEVMGVAVKKYGKEWLKMNLKKDFPPLPMVVCEANLKWLVREFKPRVKSTPEQLEKQAREIAATLTTTMGARAIDMTTHWPEDPVLREKVREFLRAE